MAQIIKLPKPRLEIADILRQHMGDYRNAYPLWPHQYKIVSDLLNCRTASLGGHIERCNHCGAERISYHSCRNRHCPKCQQMPREKWTQARKQELLPVSYFHVIFTLPHELNPIILSNKPVMLKILFKAVSKTLLVFAKKNWGGKPGFIAVLHTWDQKLNAHFHLHCLIAGGALSKNKKRWIPCKDNYLFNQQALSLVFRGKFIHHLTHAARCNNLNFGHGYRPFRNKLYTHKWVVSVREPIKQPEHVLEYLARYTHRTAIANSRIKTLQDGKVTFNTKERKKNKIVPITITAVEFIRRFLLHSLPKSFVRIRHYGFLANRNRKANLNRIRGLLKLPHQLFGKIATSLKDMMLKLTGTDITKCPCCKKGRMQRVAEIPICSGKHPYDFIRPPNYQACSA
jgi:hypothetical protein